MSKGVFEQIFSRIEKFRDKTGGVTLSHVSALTPDDELTLRGLSRVMEEYTGLPKHAALRMGEVLPPVSGGSASVSLQVLKPCKRGQPLSTVKFSGRSVAEAAHYAKRFVESILPCEDAEGS